MLTIKETVVKDMKRITLIMVAVILLLSTVVQPHSTRASAIHSALMFRTIGAVLQTQ